MPPRRARRRGMIAGAAIANARSNKAAQAAQTSAPAPAATPQTGVEPDMMKQLTDLKSLLDNGILTQAEFDAKKAQILGL
jgi:membrane protease subunit (stomatin/prohibitin family)